VATSTLEKNGEKANEFAKTMSKPFEIFEILDEILDEFYL